VAQWTARRRPIVDRRIPGSPEVTRPVSGSVKSPGRGKGGRRRTSGLRVRDLRVAGGGDGDVCAWETELQQFRANGSGLYSISAVIYLVNA